MKYLLKLTFIPFLYLIMMSVIGFSVMAIQEQMPWICFVASPLILILYVLVLIGVFYREGQTALTVRLANDMEREQIVLTGEDRPLKLQEEYKAWKGFAIALLMCAPLIILLIIHSILLLTSGTTAIGAGVISTVLYFMFFMPFRAFSLEITAYSYYLLLYTIPFMLCTIGIPYYFGARKEIKLREKLDKTEKEIYGE